MAPRTLKLTACALLWAALVTALAAYAQRPRPAASPATTATPAPNGTAAGTPSPEAKEEKPPDRLTPIAVALITSLGGVIVAIITARRAARAVENKGFRDIQQFDEMLKLTLLDRNVSDTTWEVIFNRIFASAEGRQKLLEAISIGFAFDSKYRLGLRSLVENTGSGAERLAELQTQGLEAKRPQDEITPEELEIVQKLRRSILKQSGGGGS